MAGSSAMKSTDPLPEPFASLVTTIRQNSDGTGASGENRAAVAELQARLALAQDRTGDAGHLGHMGPRHCHRRPNWRHDCRRNHRS
jgi:hypothetical protein